MSQSQIYKTITWFYKMVKFDEKFNVGKRMKITITDLFMDTSLQRLQDFTVQGVKYEKIEDSACVKTVHVWDNHGVALNVFKALKPRFKDIEDFKQKVKPNSTSLGLIKDESDSDESDKEHNQPQRIARKLLGVTKKKKIAHSDDLFDDGEFLANKQDIAELTDKKMIDEKSAEKDDEEIIVKKIVSDFAVRLIPDIDTSQFKTAEEVQAYAAKIIASFKVLYGNISIDDYVILSYTRDINAAEADLGTSGLGRYYSIYHDRLADSNIDQSNLSIMYGIVANYSVLIKLVDRYLYLNIKLNNPSTEEKATILKTNRQTKDDFLMVNNITGYLFHKIILPDRTLRIQEMSKLTRNISMKVTIGHVQTLRQNFMYNPEAYERFCDLIVKRITHKERRQIIDSVPTDKISSEEIVKEVVLLIKNKELVLTSKEVIDPIIDARSLLIEWLPELKGKSAKEIDTVGIILCVYYIQNGFSTMKAHIITKIGWGVVSMPTDFHVFIAMKKLSIRKVLFPYVPDAENICQQCDLTPEFFARHKDIQKFSDDKYLLHHLQTSEHLRSIRNSAADSKMIIAFEALNEKLRDNMKAKREARKRITS